MKTKLEMAHEYALEMLKRGDPEWRIVTDAWNLADAMWLENNEREENDIQDLSQEEEWQPDWSQAPDGADAWRMYGDGECAWLIDLGGKDFKWFDRAPSFGYTGNWQDSLRERP